MLKAITFFSIVIFSSLSFSKVDVLFHPYDSTLEKIADHFNAAEESIDMALYNVDTTAKNPVIKALQSEAIQHRIKSGHLIVRIIFEGFESKEKNQKKMKELEAMGIDARYLGIGKKMHHKFATVDTYSYSLKGPVLITGSANWSLSSRRNFNENILFFEDVKEMTYLFQDQFDLLWSQAKEFGLADNRIKRRRFVERTTLDEGLEVLFNTDNFKVTDRGFRRNKEKSFTLTRRIVKAINESTSTIDIATTRLKLRPIYESLKVAAARGVKVRLIVTMGEYLPSYLRRRTKVKTCKSIYDQKCSTSQNFAVFLNELEFENKENVEVRVKYFDLRKDLYLIKQMHSKYMIADGQEVLTGSFNWSVSAEYNHFENLVYLNGLDYPKVLNRFNDDFETLWNQNRYQYEGIRTKIIEDLKADKKIKCGLPSMTLSLKEVDQLMKASRVTKKKLEKICK